MKELKKYKVLKEFIDLKENEIVRKENEIINITEERAKELINKLGNDYIEEVKEDKK